MEYWYLYVLLGLVAGTMSVTLGIGAGLIMVPALAMVPLFGLRWEVARGVALCVMVPMALMGAIRHLTDSEPDPNQSVRPDMLIVLLVAIGAVVGAFFGFYIAKVLTGQTLRKVFAIFMMAVALYMLVGPKIRQLAAGRPTGDSGETHTQRKHP